MDIKKIITLGLLCATGIMGVHNTCDAAAQGNSDVYRRKPFKNGERRQRDIYTHPTPPQSREPSPSPQGQQNGFLRNIGTGALNVAGCTAITMVSAFALGIITLVVCVWFSPLGSAYL
ncbi:MAG: hypothetical protein LBQ03_00720 [Puniceicoccales bacterium]|jgi:hypothetical protein|nr:hypothetical protein [Puniceicoccales bacterium]